MTWKTFRDVCGLSLLAFSLAAVIGFLIMSSASAQVTCGEIERVEKTMAEKYGEYPAYRALSDDNVVTVFVNPETGSFTLVVTPPALPDAYCSAFSGEGWTQLPPPNPVKENSY